MPFMNAKKPRTLNPTEAWKSLDRAGETPLIFTARIGSAGGFFST
jgi:hypothetical protein